MAKPLMTSKRDAAASKRNASTITKGKKRTPLTAKQINAIVFRRLRKYDKMSFLECFAMFIGKAQLVEFGLKKILVHKYGYDDERIEKWTLGRVIKELKDSGMRQDFLVLTDDLLEHRNYIVHEILADDAIMRHIAGTRTRRWAQDRLDRGLFTLESVIVVHDFLFGDDYDAA